MHAWLQVVSYRRCRRFAALCLAALVAGPAAADIVGTWQVLEKDPLLDDDNWFGQFRYELVIERAGDGYVLSVPRTGARFGPAALTGDRLIADGDDPNRGPARIELRFPEPTRLEGRLDVARARRVLSGTLDPSQQLAQVGDSVESARQRAEAASQRAAAAEAQASQAAAEAERLRQQMAALSAENQRLQAAAAARPAPRPVPPPAPTRPPASGIAAAGLTLELIEPPLGADGVATVRGERPVLVGRAQAPAGLLFLRVNGRDATANAQGIFQAELAPGTAAVDIVAVDRNGTRRALNVALRAAPALRSAPPVPAAASTGGPAAVDDSPAARCYALAIAAPKPSEAALGPCREAVRIAPDVAINHYNLGVALSRLGRHAEAIMAYQEAAGRWAR